MTQAVIVAGVVLRELWVTFRLVVLLAVFIGGSALAALLPAGSAVLLDRLTATLALATTITAALAAWTVAADRGAGRVGWLVSRSVTRRGYLAGLFCGLALIGMAGAAAAVVLGWLAALSLAVPPSTPVMLAALAAAMVSTLAAVAVGLAVGLLLRPFPAAIVAAMVVGVCWTAIATGGSLLSGGSWSVPAVDRLLASPTALQDALRFAGAGLLTTAVVLTVAIVAIDRADL